MRNIALGRGSTTRPSTSMAPSFLAILVRNPRHSFRSRQCPDRHDIYPDFKREPVTGNSSGLGTQKVGASAAPLLHDTWSFGSTKIAAKIASRGIEPAPSTRHRAPDKRILEANE